MNSDEIKSLIVKVLIMALSSLAAALHQNLGADSVAAIATDVADLGVLGYGVYDHWNMKKVAETAKVIGPTVAALILFAIVGAIGIQPVRAADMAVKTPPAPSFISTLQAYPYGSNGFIIGAYVQGGGGPVNGSVAGVGSADLTTTQGSFGGTIGYAWGQKNVPIALSLEADFGITNINGNVAGFSFDGPLSFEQRFVLFTPFSNLTAYLPNFPSLGTLAPFNPLPAGVSASNMQFGLMAGIDENDISPNFPGLAQNKEWRVAPMIGIVSMEQLSNGLAWRTFVKTVFPERGVCIGPLGNACGGLGQQILAGTGIYF